MLNHSQEIEFSPLLPSLSFTAALARGKDVKRRREKERERERPDSYFPSSFVA